MKKSALFLCLLLTVSLLFSSCSFITIGPGNEKNEAETSADKNRPDYYIPTDKTPLAKEQLRAIPRATIPRSITIACTDASYFVPTEITDGFDEAKLARNKLFEDYFGCQIAASEMTVEQIAASLAEAKKSGSFFADLVVIPANRLPEFIAGGLISDIASLPYVNLDADCFCSGAVDSLSTKERVYAAAGAFSIDPSMLTVMYFNRALIEKYTSASDLTKEAESGALTWDRVFSLADEAKANGYGGHYFSAKNYRTFNDVVSLGCGFDYTVSNRDIYPVTATVTDYQANHLMKFNSSMIKGGGVFGDNAYADFIAGGSLFCFAPVSDMAQLNRAEIEIGLLPLPLAYAGAEQKSVLSEDFGVICVPDPISDASISGRALYGLCAASYEIMNDAYSYRLIMTAIRTSRDLDMVDLARGKEGCTAAVTDLVRIFDIEPVRLATRDVVNRAVFLGENPVALYKEREYGANAALYERFRGGV